MYRHCIYCAARLGSNESVAAFPVGRMLAFDGAKGRLWAVCPKCARWNLAPLEERWEAVEEAERCFADARVRVQRENIGIASLRDGTRLVRVGPALPGELAAWRYGEPFRRRQRRARVVRAVGGTLLVANAATLAAWWAGIFPLAPVLAGGVWPVLYRLVSAAEKPRGGRRLQPLPREAAPELPPMVLRRRDLNRARVALAEGGGFVLDLPEVFLPGMRQRTAGVQIGGEAAGRLLARAMVIRNADGAGERDIESARALLVQAGSPAGVLRHAMRRGPWKGLRERVTAAERAGLRYGRDTDAFAAGTPGEPMDLGIRLSHLRATAFTRLRDPMARFDLFDTETLALEMALHEESERRALEGELTLLESAWREAEEIAAIADRLADETLPRGPVAESA
jgi:hypothetical protein